MAAGGDIKVEIGFAGDIEDHSTWVNVTDDIIDVSMDFGRDNPANLWGANQAYILLSDTDRGYDPLNTAGSHYPIEPGILVRITAYNDDDAATRVWKGVTRKWEPSWYSGDQAGTVLVTCLDLIGVLNQPMPYSPDDWLGAKTLDGASGFYTFNSDLVDATSGLISDVSGQGRDGIGFSDDDPATVGATISGTGVDAYIDLNSPAMIQLGMGGLDSVSSGNGLFAYSETRLVARAGSLQFGGTDEWTWPIMAQDGTSGGNWLLYVGEHDTTGATTLNFRYLHGVDSATTHTLTLTSNTMSDHISTKRRVFGVGIEGDEVTLFACVPREGTGTLDGTNTVLSDTFTYGYAGPQSSGSDHLTKLNQYSTIAPGSADVWRAGIVHSSASESFCLGFVDSYQVRGALDLDSDDRLASVIGDVPLPASATTVAFDSAIDLSPAGYIGFESVLDMVNTLVRMGRGRLFQQPNSAGTIQIEDEDGSSTSSGATWSDQGTNPGWSSGTAVIKTGFDDVINHVSVRLPNGYVASALDQTSIDQVGVRARVWDLPFMNDSDADTFCADLIARYKTRKLSVSFRAEPVVSAATWDNLSDANEIGDTVVWQHQPLGAGSVTSTTMEVGGERWAWAQDLQKWSVVVHLEPNRT